MAARIVVPPEWDAVGMLSEGVAAGDGQTYLWRRVIADTKCASTRAARFREHRLQFMLRCQAGLIAEFFGLQQPHR